MNPRSWIRDLFARTPHTVRKAPGRSRPRLEALEDRFAPASFTVTSLADTVNAGDGALTLREAILAANVDATADTVAFQAGLNGTIALTGGEMRITSPVTVTGNGAANTVIDARQLSRIFNITSTAGAVTLDGLTLINGRTTGPGFGVGGEGGTVRTTAAGLLTINRCTLAGNSTTGTFAQGGAVFSDSGPLSVNQSTLSGNYTTGNGSSQTYYNFADRPRDWGAVGGAIFNKRGTTTISQSTLTQNYTSGAVSGGGALGTTFGVLIVRESTLSGNYTTGAQAAGGAILTFDISVPVQIIDCTVVANHTSGGEFASGGAIQSQIVDATRSVFRGNSSTYGGGAIAAIRPDLSGPAKVSSFVQCTMVGNSAPNSTGGAIYGFLTTIDVRQSTFAENTAGMGGAIFTTTFFAAEAELRVSQSTFGGNSATSNGGAIHAFNCVATVSQSTLSGNTADNGGGIATGEPLTLDNSIVAGNTANTNADLNIISGGGGVLTARSSLIGKNEGTGLHPSPTGPDANGNWIGDAAGLIPRLMPLADNGGPTQTMALRPFSLAFNAGSSALIPAGVTTDQRGSGFDRNRGGAVDIGAFEVQDDPPTITVSNPALTVDEGSTVANSGAFSDPQGPDTVSLAASLGFISGNYTLGAWAWSHGAGDGPSGPTTVTITAIDAYALTSSTTFTLTVRNVAPTPIILNYPATGHSPEGTAISLGSLVFDPSAIDQLAGFTRAWSVTRNGAAYATGSGPDFSFTPADDGAYMVTLTATDKDGGVGSASTTILVDNVPTVAGTRVNSGSAQRSRVTDLSVTIDTQVTFAGPVASAFTLTRIGGGSVAFSATASIVNGVTVVTLNNFNGAETEFGSLRDGRYTLTALAAQISAGGQQMAANYSFGDAQGLYRLFGDVTGDRRIDISDFGGLSTTYNRLSSDPLFNPIFDYNNDGRIDIIDFGQFSVRFFTTLP